MQPIEGAASKSETAAVFPIFLIFLRLGLTSFGGPVAHLGYFREEFVTRRKWLSEYSYADLVALCQFLPGPASSQVGLALGLSRGGYAGAAAAWLGFTLPSAVALTLFANGLAHYGSALAPGALHGLKIVAVAVVAQAVWGMARTLCPDLPRITIMVAACCSIMTRSSQDTVQPKQCPARYLLLQHFWGRPQTARYLVGWAEFCVCWQSLPRLFY